MSAKVCILSIFPITVDNVGGPSALPYHFFRDIADRYIIDSYYYNYGNIDSSNIQEASANLGIRSHLEITPQKKSQRLNFFRKRSQEGLPKNLDKYNVVDSYLKLINNEGYDLVWLYQFWLYDWVDKIRAKNIVISGMDSPSLHNYRVIKEGLFVDKKDLATNYQNFLQNIELEQKISKTDSQVHFVGKADMNFYHENTAAVSSYVAHPHPNLAEKPELFTTKGKLEILVTGNADSIYINQGIQEFIEALIDSPELANSFKIKFIGRNFHDFYKGLLSNEYQVEYIEWVDNYEQELIKSDIQLFPILVGTGTKGKVLHALGSGLLGIGTSYAFENIHLKDGVDAIYIDSIKYQLADKLLEIANNRDRAREIAISGSKVIRKLHNPKKLGQEFIDHYLNHNN